MLNSLTSRNQNQRQRATKVKRGLRTWLFLAVGVWMVYQLRAFLNHKVSNENGSSLKDETRIEQLKLGRKGLILSDSETRKPGEEGEVEKGKEKDENQQEMEEESEDLVGVVDKGGDADDEELGVVKFDDPMEEIESLDEDDGDTDGEGDDNATTDQHSEGEDDKLETRISEVS